MQRIVLLLLLHGGASIGLAAGAETLTGVEAVGITVKDMRAGQQGTRC